MTADFASSDSIHDGLASDVLTDVLDKIGEIAKAASNGSFVFRGEPKWYLEIPSSLYREYKTLLEPFGVDGFYTHSVVSVCCKLDVRFSITIRQHKSLRNLIEAIPEADWTSIPYWMDGAADVAETTYTPSRVSPAPRRCGSSSGG